MPIIINGSGTVTGISPGGLPDLSITTSELVDGSVTSAKIASATIAQTNLDTSVIPLGLNQTYTVYVNAGTGSSRVSGTTYTNTTGRPIFVQAGCVGTAASLTVAVSGTTIAAQTSAGSSITSISCIVPPSATYLITVVTGSLYYWSELR